MKPEIESPGMIPNSDFEEYLNEINTKYKYRIIDGEEIVVSDVSHIIIYPGFIELRDEHCGIITLINRENRKVYFNKTRLGDFVQIGFVYITESGEYKDSYRVQAKKDEGKIVLTGTLNTSDDETHETIITVVKKE